MAPGSGGLQSANQILNFNAPEALSVPAVGPWTIGLMALLLAASSLGSIRLRATRIDG